MKLLITILVLAGVAAAGYFVYQNYQPAASQENNTQNQNPPQSGGTQQNLITYTDSGYSPNPLRIKAGETVTWKNDSAQGMWTASAMHPTHAVYPTTGGCIGSTFDSCKAMQPGESWSFKFDIAGEWRYHNHVNPSLFGAVIVE